MKKLLVIWGMILFLVPCSEPAAKELPLIDGKRAVATVNGEPITLDDFNAAIAASHATKTEEGRMTAGSIDYKNIMNRLINTRLILIEAHNMGLDELPEIQSSVAAFEKETLMKMLMNQEVDAVKPDPKDVERIYRDMVREWKIKSIKFKAESDSKKFREQIDKGKEFDTLAEEAVQQQLAEADAQGEYLKTADLTIPVAQVIAEMDRGSVSPILSLGKEGFIVFRVEDIRYPEEAQAEAMAEARKQAENQARMNAAREYYASLKEQYVTIDEPLLNELDFEAGHPGFKALMKDERIVATIKNDEDITVGELAQALDKKFYHGIDLAIANKNVNKKKREILEDILQKRLLVKAAKQAGIEHSDEFKRQVKEHRESLIFGAFVRKAVFSDIKLEINELKRYYDENKEEYATPLMLRIEGLAFDKRNAAQTALDKLAGGTDIGWLRKHAEGKVPVTAKGLLPFEGRIYSFDSLPRGVQKALRGVEEGDARLYHHEDDDRFYVLYLINVFPSRQKPFDEVKEEVREAVFSEKSVEAISSWAEKLKEYYPVKVFRKDLRP